jgi:hypothetical protein
MLKILDDYDWGQAFQYCGEQNEEEYFQSGSPDIRTIPGFPVSNATFRRSDVVEILGYSEGYNDGPAWLMLGKLNDGRYFALTAGCDYTGWDCQASGTVFLTPTLDLALSYGFDANERARLQPYLPVVEKEPEPTVTTRPEDDLEVVLKTYGLQIQNLFARMSSLEAIVNASGS